MDPSEIAPALLGWWDTHGRKDLPWQLEPSPYRVWVSEIMLQQTQVATVERYFARFLAAFPSAGALADAGIDDVLHLWSGLGYYARARNLHRAAGIVRDEHAGHVPTDFDALIALPGIGRSTAGAILALACGQRHAILDGNAKRVLARLHAVEGWPGTSANQKRLWQAAETATPAARVANYTQAIMDLGATICTRSRPACDHCPLAFGCQAFAQRLTGRIPAPRPRRARPRRSKFFIVLERADGAVLLERRPPDGIWGGLWCFPEADTVPEATRWCETVLGRAPQRVRVGTAVRHGFTHFELDMMPVQMRIDRCGPGVMDGDNRLWYNRRSPAPIGLAAPVARMLAATGEKP